MGIRQLNGSYIPAEDRILFRVSTDAGEEFRFWLTRPVTAHFLGAMHTLAARAVEQKFPPQVAQTVTEFQQQAVEQQTKLDDQFVPGATFPLGEAPALVVKLALTPIDGGISLDLGMPNGANLNLRVALQLAQQLGVLFDRLQKDGNWMIVPAVPAKTADAPTAAAGGQKIVH